VLIPHRAIYRFGRSHELVAQFIFIFIDDSLKEK